MAYLVYNPSVAVFSLDSLSGVGDAPPGYIARSPEGDIHVLAPGGWVKVFDHTDGTDFTPDYPLADTQVIVSDGGTIDIGGEGVTTATGTLDVSGGTLQGASLVSTAAIVTDGQTLAVTGGTVTLSVADNTVTAEYTAA